MPKMKLETCRFNSFHNQKQNKEMHSLLEKQLVPVMLYITLGARNCLSTVNDSCLGLMFFCHRMDFTVERKEIWGLMSALCCLKLAIEN